MNQEIGEWRESETTQQRKDNTELGEITEKHESDIEDEFQTIPIESSTMSSSLTSTFSSFKETNVFVTIWRGWSLYFNQNVFLVSISFVLLFATLFVPGILLIGILLFLDFFMISRELILLLFLAYMKTMSISDLEIGVFYVCSLVQHHIHTNFHLILFNFFTSLFFMFFEYSQCDLFE